MARKRLGNQQPTQSVFVSNRNSLYKEAVFLYEKSSRKAQKWQINLLKPMLARTVKGLWFQTNFGYAVPRRNGKNEVVAMRELFGLASEKRFSTRAQTITSHTVLSGSACCSIAKIQHESLRAAGRERIDTESGGRLALHNFARSFRSAPSLDLFIRQAEAFQEFTFHLFLHPPSFPDMPTGAAHF